MALRLLLLDDGEQQLLIDTGMGHKWSEKEISMFKVEQPGHALDAALKPHGLERSDINAVILTHLHFDHAGGATISAGNEVIPAFENARYYTQRSQWELANNPSPKDRASFRADNFVPLHNHKCLELLDGPAEILPGIEILVGNGHTDGHQMVKITGGGESALFLGDTIPTTAHLKLPFIMGYDLRPMETLVEKQMLLEQAAEENWWLFFDHDPDIPGVKIKPGERHVEIIDYYGR